MLKIGSLCVLSGNTLYLDNVEYIVEVFDYKNQILPDGIKGDGDVYKVFYVDKDNDDTIYSICRIPAISVEGCLFKIKIVSALDKHCVVDNYFKTLPKKIVAHIKEKTFEEICENRDERFVFRNMDTIFKAEAFIPEITDLQVKLFYTMIKPAYDSPYNGLCYLEKVNPFEELAFNNDTRLDINNKIKNEELLDTIYVLSKTGPSSRQCNNVTLKDIYIFLRHYDIEKLKEVIAFDVTYVSPHPTFGYEISKVNLYRKNMQQFLNVGESYYINGNVLISGQDEYVISTHDTDNAKENGLPEDMYAVIMANKTTDGFEYIICKYPITAVGKSFFKIRIMETSENSEHFDNINKEDNRNPIDTTKVENKMLKVDDVCILIGDVLLKNNTEYSIEISDYNNKKLPNGIVGEPDTYKVLRVEETDDGIIYHIRKNLVFTLGDNFFKMKIIKELERRFPLNFLYDFSNGALLDNFVNFINIENKKRKENINVDFLLTKICNTISDIYLKILYYKILLKRPLLEVCKEIGIGRYKIYEIEKKLLNILKHPKAGIVDLLYEKDVLSE